jgi:hypothetical protein
VLPRRGLADAEPVRRGRDGPGPDVRAQDLELPAGGRFGVVMKLRGYPSPQRIDLGYCDRYHAPIQPGRWGIDGPTLGA